jgi:hypothetical protein
VSAEVGTLRGQAVWWLTVARVTFITPNHDDPKGEPMTRPATLDHDTPISDILAWYDEEPEVVRLLLRTYLVENGLHGCLSVQVEVTA